MVSTHIAMIRRLETPVISTVIAAARSAGPRLDAPRMAISTAWSNADTTACPVIAMIETMSAMTSGVA